MKILSVFGTRPEAIKMASVVRALDEHPAVESLVCVTGQHRQMLDQMMTFFGMSADFDLNLMQPNQSLSSISQKTIARLEPIIKEASPDCILVQGDTTTAMIAALAAFYQKIPVAHIEAGLRTNNIYSPWPEEMNRKLVGSLARWHFAPTKGTALNLLNEGVSQDRIFTVGNTVVDSLLDVVRRFKDDALLRESMEGEFSYINFNKKLILVTGHRRENLDSGLSQMCQALVELSKRDDVEIVYPVHLNPIVQATARRILSGCSNIHLIEPLNYLPFVYLLSRCYMVITDSGGVQEEAPSLGKPILVTRDTTERAEGIDAGTAKLVGTNKECLLRETMILLTDKAAYKDMSEASNPYGDGLSANRIVNILVNELSTKAASVEKETATV